MLIVVFVMLVLIVFRHMYFLSVELGSYVIQLGDLATCGKTF